MKKIALGILLLVSVFFLGGCFSKQVENVDMTLALSVGERTGVYSGTTRKDLPDGEGVFIRKENGKILWIHKGMWKEGHMEGNGETTWPQDKLKIVGSFSNDKANGPCKTYFNEKLLFDGEYKDHKYAKGKLYDTLTGKMIYEGEFDEKEVPKGTFYVPVHFFSDEKLTKFAESFSKGSDIYIVLDLMFKSFNTPSLLITIYDVNNNESIIDRSSISINPEWTAFTSHLNLVLPKGKFKIVITTLEGKKFGEGQFEIK